MYAAKSEFYLMIMISNNIELVCKGRGMYDTTKTPPLFPSTQLPEPIEDVTVPEIEDLFGCVLM